jgi:hypothetical protein
MEAILKAMGELRTSGNIRTWGPIMMMLININKPTLSDVAVKDILLELRKDDFYILCTKF